MKHVELLSIEESFEIIGRGVVVIPDFPVPRGWKDRTETVVVVQPNGQHLEATALFNMSHFTFTDPNVPLDKRWRVVVQLLDKKKEDLPIGSKILVSQEARDAILPSNAP